MVRGREREKEKEKGRRRERGRRDEKRNVGGETVKSRQKRKKGGKRTSAQRTRSCGKDCSLNWKTNYGGSGQDEAARKTETISCA